VFLGLQGSLSTCQVVLLRNLLQRASDGPLAVSMQAVLPSVTVPPLKRQVHSALAKAVALKRSAAAMVAACVTPILRIDADSMAMSNAHMPDPTPRDVVNKQLRVYNARDIDGYCALFAAEATISDLVTGQMICDGIAHIREVYSKRFADHPELHCVVHQRMEGADFAIDKETVSGLPAGPLHLMAIYEVRAGLIRSLRFIRWN
jgi:hypothetical protein